MPEILTSIDIKAPIQRVWDEITRAGTCRPMFETVYHRVLEAGKPFRYSSADGKRTFVFGEFVEIEPPRRLVHTFNSAFDGGKEPETLVTWTLAETAPGVTRVTLRHERFPTESRTFKGVTKGWAEILEMFRVGIERGTYPFRPRLRNRVMAAISFMMPGSTLTARLDEKYRRVV